MPDKFNLPFTPFEKDLSQPIVDDPETPRHKLCFYYINIVFPDFLIACYKT